MHIILRVIAALYFAFVSEIMTELVLLSRGASETSSFQIAVVTCVFIGALCFISLTHLFKKPALPS